MRSLHGQGRSYCMLVWGLILACSLNMTACEKAEGPPPDPLMTVLSAVERGAWQLIADHFSDEHPLSDFPLKKATDAGGIIDGVKRIREIDRHLIFDVDLRAKEDTQGAQGSAKRLTRYSFWMELTTPERLPSEPPSALSIGEVKGWSSGRLISAPLIKLTDINTPSRFSATSFRGVPDLQSLAVFDADNLDLKGWSATMIKLEPTLKPLKKRGCRRVNVRVSRAVLDKEIKTCTPLLAREAQRAHQMGAITIKGDVALHDQDRGSFAGSLTMMLALDYDVQMRPEPSLIEAMIIGGEFTGCVQKKLSQWSKDYIPRAACELTLPMLFKVSMPLQTSLEGLVQDQAQGVEEGGTGSKQGPAEGDEER